MPVPEEADREQKAVLWPKTGYGNDGQPTLGTAIELDVRWVKTQRLAKNAKGETISIDATVRVDREIEIGSVMWQGELADFEDSGGAGTDELMEVVVYDETPDVKARETAYRVGLGYYKGSFTGIG